MRDFDSRENRRADHRNKKGEPKEPPRWRGPGRSVVFWIALFLLVFITYQWFAGFDNDAPEITYTEF